MATASHVTTTEEKNPPPRSRDAHEVRIRDPPVETPRGDPRREQRDDRRPPGGDVRQPDIRIPGFTDSSNLGDAPGRMPGAGDFGKPGTKLKSC